MKYFYGKNIFGPLLSYQRFISPLKFLYQKVMTVFYFYFESKKHFNFWDTSVALISLICFSIIFNVHYEGEYL